MSLASTDEIRSHFPALRRIHAGHPVAYFDGPGGTQVPSSVAGAVTDYLFHKNATAHWAFPTSAETDEVRWGARVAMADFLGGRAEEIVFGANMTTLTFHLSRALGGTLNPGDELVVTELDHSSNVDPWKRLAGELGLVVRTVPMDPTSGTLQLDQFAETLNERTRLVALGAASNALGTLTIIPPLARMAREAGARVFVDAVHMAPHRRIDVEALECDFLACSPYKFYGPHAGVLWGREELLEELEVPRLSPAPQHGPERWETGNANSEAMAGTTAAVDFLAGLAAGSPEGGEDGASSESGGSRRELLDRFFEGLARRENQLLGRLWEGLDAIPGVRLFGPEPGPERAPTLSLVVDGLPSREVSRRMAAEKGVFLSHGDFYAVTVADRLGVRPHGFVRAGISLYTTEEEVDRLVAGIRAMA